jgi:NifU-like protein involved in Fe-S cluster formation
MDKAIIKYYRRLTKEGYKYAGTLEEPSVFLTDSSGGRIRICSSIGSYLNLYIKIGDGVITAMRYSGTANPATHVAVEILCILVEGKTLDEACGLTEADFYRILGSESAELRPKVLNLIELLKSGIRQYRRGHDD